MAEWETLPASEVSFRAFAVLIFLGRRYLSNNGRWPRTRTVQRGEVKEKQNCCLRQNGISLLWIHRFGKSDIRFGVNHVDKYENTLSWKLIPVNVFTSNRWRGRRIETKAE